MYCELRLVFFGVLFLCGQPALADDLEFTRREFKVPEEFTMSKEYMDGGIGVFHRGLVHRLETKDGKLAASLSATIHHPFIPKTVYRLTDTSASYDVGYPALIEGDYAVFFPPLHSTVYRVDEIHHEFVRLRIVPKEKLPKHLAIPEKSYCVPLGLHSSSTGRLYNEAFNVELVENPNEKPKARVRSIRGSDDGEEYAVGDFVQFEEGKHKLLKIIPPNKEVPGPGWIVLDPVPAKE